MPDSQTLFAAVGATGFLLLLISLVLGELAGPDGEFGHEVDSHPGPLPDGSAGSPAEQAGFEAPTWFSIRVLAVALVGFGAGGMVAEFLGAPAALAWPVAAVGFVATGALTYRYIIRPMAAQQYNSLRSHYGWIGRSAVVTLEIRANGTGQVVFHDRDGARITRTATSDLDEAIPKGATVTVVGAASGGVVVHRNAFSD